METKTPRRLSQKQIAAMVAGKRAKVRTLAERYWEKVDKRGPDECWPWLANKNPHGYGQIYPGADRSNGKVAATIFAHHVATELAGIEVPAGMVRDHICKRRDCQNPAHIRVVPQFINATDNSDSPHGVNSRKTVCDYGHPLTGDNVRVIYVIDRRAKMRGLERRRPTRVCIACQERRLVEARVKRNAAPLPEAPR